MILADGGIPSLGLIVAVLVGGALAAGGANTINCWIERDRDQLMRRTRGRPLPAGDVDPRGRLVFGLVLEVLAFALLWSTVNLLAAVARGERDAVLRVRVHDLAQAPEPAEHRDRRRGRRRPGARRLGCGHRQPRGAGVGAVRDRVLLDAAALLGAVAALPATTTPPPASRCSRWRRASAVAARQILVYAVVVVVVSLLLPLTTPMAPLYVVVGLRARHRVRRGSARQLHRDPTPERAIRLFMFSNTYLALLFAAVAVDTLIS